MELLFFTFNIFCLPDLHLFKRQLFFIFWFLLSIFSAAGSKQNADSSISSAMLGGIIAGAAILLIILVIIGFLVHKKFLQKKLPPTDFETRAHENPTYEVTPGMVIENGQETVVADPAYEVLPEQRKRPESTESRESSYLPDVVHAVAGPDGTTSDTEQLVAVSSEITMDISDGDHVAYKKQWFYWLDSLNLSAHDIYR